ncbi:MAG: DinB/UmuC family translesion DNA polymerase, partial [Ilumatobacteraceae bacterium]
DAAVRDLALRTLAEITAESRIVTRVAVTVRSSAFFTRTKIRKLEKPSIDPDVVVPVALRVLDMFELDRPVRLLGVRLELAMPD